MQKICDQKSTLANVFYDKDIVTVFTVTFDTK